MRERLRHVDGNAMHARKFDETGLRICAVALCGSKSRRTWNDESVDCLRCKKILEKRQANAERGQQ